MFGRKLSDIKKPDTIQENYPVPPCDASVEDDYFGVRIKDPFRPLEESGSPEVNAWIDAQNRLTEAYIGKIPCRDAIKRRLEELHNGKRYGVPKRCGKYLFFFRNDGLQDQSSVYRQHIDGGEEELFLDPAKLGSGQNISITGITISNDNKYLAFTFSESGSDWSEIGVVEADTGVILNDKIRWVKFVVPEWCGDGFFYSGYEEPDTKGRFSESSRSQKVFFHKLNSGQREDAVVYRDDKNPLRYFSPKVSKEETHLFIHISEGTSGSEIICRKIGEVNFHTLFEGFSYNYDIVECREGKALIITDEGAEKYRLIEVAVDASRSLVREVIAEGEALMESVATIGEYLLVHRIEDASSRVYIHDRGGKLLDGVALPGIGTAEGFSGEGEEVYYNFSSFNIPAGIYVYNIRSGKSLPFRKNSNISFDPDNFSVERHMFPSSDGTKIYMFVVSKKGIVKDGENPLHLYGYGGFNISLTPVFSPANLLFIEQGGIYVVVNLRGGGEYGEAWHRAGMLENKQNVFDDFMSAAEYLINEGYTSRNKIVVSGGSNGGLLVGACITQRPELYAAAVVRVGVLDMLRYHKFTVGWGWVVEYGSSDDKEQLNYLLKYSPLHNVKSGHCYPATLVMTGDHDDRVVPAHSFKFAAALQRAQGCEKIILLRVDRNAGHGAGKSITKIIDEAADMLSFIFHQTETDITIP